MLEDIVVVFSKVGDGINTSKAQIMTYLVLAQNVIRMCSNSSGTKYKLERTAKRT